MNGFPLGSVSAEAGLYIQGDPMLFWYSQDVSYGTLGFDTLSNSFSSDSTTLNTGMFPIRSLKITQLMSPI